MNQEGSLDLFQIGFFGGKGLPSSLPLLSQVLTINFCIVSAEQNSDLRAALKSMKQIPTHMLAAKISCNLAVY